MLKQLDITKDHCPMTFVKTKLELERLSSGDQLAVHLIGDEPLENVPRSAIEAGYNVLEISQEEGQVHTVVIEKP